MGDPLLQSVDFQLQLVALDRELLPHLVRRLMAFSQLFSVVCGNRASGCLIKGLVLESQSRQGIGKSIGGGLPISGIVGKAYIIDSVPPGGLVEHLAATRLPARLRLRCWMKLNKKTYCNVASTWGTKSTPVCEKWRGVTPSTALATCEDLAA